MPPPLDELDDDEHQALIGVSPPLPSGSLQSLSRL
jgi:hypothetical protein